MTEKIETNKVFDEYADVGFCACFLKKNVNVLKYLSGLALSAMFTATVCLAFLVMILLMAQVVDYFGPSVVSFLMQILLGLSPWVYVALAIILPIPVYSVIWCIRYRRQKRAERELERCGILGDVM